MASRGLLHCISAAHIRAAHEGVAGAGQSTRFRSSAPGERAALGVAVLRGWSASGACIALPLTSANVVAGARRTLAALLRRLDGVDAVLTPVRRRHALAPAPRPRRRFERRHAVPDPVRPHQTTRRRQRAADKRATDAQWTSRNSMRGARRPTVLAPHGAAPCRWWRRRRCTVGAVVHAQHAADGGPSPRPVVAHHVRSGSARQRPFARQG